MLTFKHWFVVASLLVPGRASAQHHVIWLDFSDFNLNSFPTVNGNSPATVADRDAIQDQVVTNMARDYASVDVYFTRFRPRNGRHTRVRFLGRDEGGLFGCAGGSCCADGQCTGLGSWNDRIVSAVEIYAGSFGDMVEFSGANATTARIGNGLSHTGSHELGHVLGLEHCHAADDALEVGCGDATAESEDQNVNWHVMSSGASWGLTGAQRATRDRFFSLHSERRLLHCAFQQNSHFDLFGDVDHNKRSDLLLNRFVVPGSVDFLASLSTGTTFAPEASWGTGLDEPNIVMHGDVNGDGRADYVAGRILAADQVEWTVLLSTGSALGAPEIWRADAGDAGDIFRLADVNGDRRSDLVYGRPLSSTQIRWYVRLSTGTSFGPVSTWRNDAGDEGDIFLLGDVDADGDADLAYGRTLSDDVVRWYVRLSNGSAFGPYSTWRKDAGDRGDLFYLADSGGDGDADLNYARTMSSSRMKWYYRRSDGNGFGPLMTWSSDAGNAGDLFRFGDGDGDGWVDLFYARPRGIDSRTVAPDLSLIRWYGRYSLGGSFGDLALWINDAGEEGIMFP